MGTEAFWVPAAIAAVGAGTQYVNQDKAAKRSTAAQTQAIINQGEKRQEANAQVRGLTQAIAGNSPQQQAAKSTGEYVSQLRKNAAGSTQGGSTKDGNQTFGQSTSALPSAAGASSRYASGVADSQREVENYGNEYASNLGELDAATRQRQNEGLGMQTLGTNLNTIGLASYGQNFVDQLRAQAQGQANPWVSLMGNLIGGTGNAMSMNPEGYGLGGSKYAKIGKGGYSKIGTPIDAGNGLGDMAGAFT